MHWSKPRESRARLGEASRESRETTLAKSRDAREMWRKYPTMHRKLAGTKTKTVCCRDVKVAASNYFEFSITAIAKFAPAMPTYGGSSFHDEVGTCYCRQIRYLIVNDAFKWAILRVRYSRTDINTGTSHLMSMSSSFKLYRMFLLTKCFVICEKWLWNVLLDCFKQVGTQWQCSHTQWQFTRHKHATNLGLGTEMAKWLRCERGVVSYVVNRTLWTF